jgi:hypothetical protein
MPKVVPLKTPTKPYEPPVQFDFWEIDDPDHRLTNTIALWDVAPRCVFRHADDIRISSGDGKYLKTIERTFTHGGSVYMVTLTPARIRREGKDTEQYPGEREQLVEEVIRQIAVMKNRLSLIAGDKGEVGVTFSIYEVDKELERTGHKFSFYEIQDALSVLHKSTVEIVRLVEGKDGTIKEPMVSGSTFPMYRSGDRRSAESSTTVGFNWLVSQALIHLDFRQMDYEVIMRLKGPIERWLYRRLNHEMFFQRSPSIAHVIRASEIIDGCGLTGWTRLRDVLRRVTHAVMALKGEGIVADVETRDIMQGRSKVDIEYTIIASENLAKNMAQAQTIALRKKQDFREVTGSDPVAFIPNDTEKRARLRRIRSQRLAEEKALSLPLDGK